MFKERLASDEHLQDRDRHRGCRPSDGLQGTKTSRSSKQHAKRKEFSGFCASISGSRPHRYRRSRRTAGSLGLGDGEFFVARSSADLNTRGMSSFSGREIAFRPKTPSASQTLTNVIEPKATNHVGPDHGRRSGSLTSAEEIRAAACSRHVQDRISLDTEGCISRRWIFRRGFSFAYLDQIAASERFGCRSRRNFIWKT